MGVLSSAQFAAYARDEIHAADVILTDHTAHGAMCSCGRVVPCSVAFAVTRRRAYFVGVLARVVAIPVVGHARVEACPRCPP